MSSKVQTNNYSAIDAAKFLMAVFVVTIHTDPLCNFYNPVVQTVYGCFLHSAVPFFFLATGFLLAKKGSSPDRDLQPVIHRHLVKTVKLYTLWHILYLPLVIHHFYTHDYSVIKSILVTLRAYFVVGKTFNADILWYLLSSIYALAFVAILLKYRTPVLRIVFFGSLIYAFGIFFPYITYCSDSTPAVMRTVKQTLSMVFTTGRIFTGFFYIPLGMLIAKRTPPLICGLILFIGGFIGNYLLSGVPGTLMLAIQATGTFITVSNLSLPAAPVYPFLRKSSTNLYFLHQWVMFAYGFLTHQLHKQGPVVFLVTLSVSMLLSTLWIVLQQRTSRKT